MVLRAHRVPGMDDEVPAPAQVFRMSTSEALQPPLLPIASSARQTREDSESRWGIVPICRGDRSPLMADAQECRRQAAECTRLSRTRVTIRSETIMRAMARSWVALAVQMDRLDEHDPVNAAHLALPR